MSAVALPTSAGNIPIGTFVVVDPSTYLARAYDIADSLDSVVGVSYPTSNTSGRAFGNIDGPLFYTNDYNEWSNTLQYLVDGDGNQIPNPDYVSWNPYGDTTDYVVVVRYGMVPVLSSYTSWPTGWVQVAANSDYNWFLI